MVNSQPKTISKDNSINLSASENDLFLEFYAKTDDSTTFLYCLKGSTEHQNWFESAYPTAHFQDLDEENYVFQIKKNVKNSVITSIKINKKKAFWHKAWFYPVIFIYIIILIGVGIYLFFLYDFRQKLRLQGVRNQIAADLHDEVGSNLNSIAIFVEVLKNKVSKDTLPILEKIIESSKESVSLMQDTVWTINPKNDSVDKLFDRMQSFATQLMANSEIAFDFEVKADLKRTNFTMEQRKNIYLIFKESINNIVKHAQASKAKASIFKENDAIKIIIEDNGKGFDTTQDFEGNGLQNFKTRAEEAEFECNVISKIGVGTKVGIIVFL